MRAAFIAPLSESGKPMNVLKKGIGESKGPVGCNFNLWSLFSQAFRCFRLCLACWHDEV